jgi:pyridinium-3,5-bisthiocarboxylic acid mononucleotide nickel chelatase
LTALYFDCFSGASGDMILGALIDAGVKLEDVRRALGSLAITPETVWTEPVVRGGIRATKFNVRGEAHPSDPHHHKHGHEHKHGKTGESHRTLSEIFCLVDSSSLSGAAKDRTKELFTRLGEVEAAIHGTSLERVHLHEVGALDSIIDIAGTVFALEQLGADTILSSPLNVGGGTIHSAHGRYPVPAPATAKLLTGAPIYSGAEQVELVTPTGALLIAGYASTFGPLPAMRVNRIGYGAGTRDFPSSPNVLRVLIGELDTTAPAQSVVVIEAEIDDMNPQIYGVLMDRLLAEGALDVFYTSIQMKKNRPGTLLTVIGRPGHKDRLTATIFREATTIGVRYREMAREVLDRESITVTTELGPVRVKVARRGGELLNAAPEFEDCVRLATEHQLPTKHVQALAMKAYLETTKRGL